MAQDKLLRYRCPQNQAHQKKNGGFGPPKWKSQRKTYNPQGISGNIEGLYAFAGVFAFYSPFEIVLPAAADCQAKTLLFPRLLTPAFPSRLSPTAQRSDVSLISGLSGLRHIAARFPQKTRSLPCPKRVCWFCSLEFCSWPASAPLNPSCLTCRGRASMPSLPSASVSPTSLSTTIAPHQWPPSLGQTRPLRASLARRSQRKHHHYFHRSCHHRRPIAR